jgi:hypothetical protein
MFIWLAIIIIALPAAAFALALVSEMFAFSLSRAVEAAFERVEYRMAVRERARATRERELHATEVPVRRGEAVGFGASVARAA